MLSVRPWLKPDDVKRLLTKTATGISGSSSDIGSGLINVAAASQAGAINNSTQTFAQSVGDGTLEGARHLARGDRQRRPLRGAGHLRQAVAAGNGRRRGGGGDLVGWQLQRCNLVGRDVVGRDVVRRDLVRCHLVRCHVVGRDVVGRHLVRCHLVGCDVVGQHVVREYLVGR